MASRLTMNSIVNKRIQTEDRMTEKRVQSFQIDCRLDRRSRNLRGGYAPVRKHIGQTSIKDPTAAEMTKVSLKK